MGTPKQAGSQSITSATWSISGGGKDIWNAADAFHYVWRPFTYGAVGARVLSLQNASFWAKAGVMVRQSTASNSSYYFVAVTPAFVLVQYRDTTITTTAQSVFWSYHYALAKGPLSLDIVRQGNVFTTYYALGGMPWTMISGSSRTIAMTGTVTAGLAVTAHNDKATTTATFDGVAMSPASQ